ncbi:MAG: DnaJ domain-containing protein [Thermodesulfobacteriota bacterium]|nr:DnaJ domain-containing protein [Thermodesulfobacteriota bacterium]
MKFWIYLLSLVYVLSPYDILPDFFMGVGWIDDISILGLLWWYHFIYRTKKKTHDEKYKGFQKNTEGEKKEKFGGSQYDRAGADSQKKPGNGDPYKVLGVKRDASTEEIKTAYRRLVNQYHPDKVMHLGEEFRILAERKFKEIQEAYQDLKIQG